MSSNADEMLDEGEDVDVTAPRDEPAPMPTEARSEQSEAPSDEPSAPGEGDDDEAPQDDDHGARHEARPRRNDASADAMPDSGGAPEQDGGDEQFAEDGRADRALDFVVDVLTSMGLDCTVDLMENGDEDPPSDIRIEVSGRDSDRLVGKKGQTLAALQFLVNRVVNRPPLPRRHILLDAGGYRARRESALSSMALRLGQQASDEGKIITFEPMSAQDRRVVHLALAKFAGVVTKSEGKGATRRVQIIPVRD